MSHTRYGLGQLAARRSNVIATAWLAITFLWVVVIFATDVLAWPIVIWIATTIGPIKALGAAHRGTELADAHKIATTAPERTASNGN